ncbi:hypothetical protein AbraIFM66950_009266 [Aspergillus brasiliensis]|nr:hypothetical protein AbraIFM66950_009266 [Aspergillus brasiliensis]
MPNFFVGEALPLDILLDETRWEELDHPAFLSRHTKLIRELETQQIGVPVQIMAPEHDSQFTKDLKAFNNVVLPTLGVPYEFQYFPSSSHGFATPGDLNDREEMWGAERTKDAAVLWFHHWLREQRKQN